MKNLSRELVSRIQEISRPVKIMHVCGSHEHTIMQHGVRSLLPEEVEVVAGPGCPVCCVPAREIDECIELARQGVTITTFGDMLRVPGSRGSLADARADGADVRIVYGVGNAVEIARKLDREVVFMAAGFETTAPTTASEILSGPPENFSVLSCHRLIPPALRFLIESGEVNLNALIEPGHVSTIIGMKPYEPFSRDYNIPQVIAGFNPLDILMAVYMILRQIDRGEAKVENEYKRAVKPEGNLKAQKVMDEVFKVTEREWRGFPVIPESVYEIRDEFSEFNAREKFDIEVEDTVDTPAGCICGAVLRGVARPEECKLFKNECTPTSPIGACMVSREGTCNIAYRYSSF
ncbi:MAG: hydrogenase expression/formation protein HypD [Methanothermobacter sp.]|jgi:hydrogenase expression/formation protein HypD|uniref:Hydrogenase expression/formation protein HypD n=1 Tax=Methanothermobacter thermautotrophicus (strain ATCC 29096 / DSM 1053 / JCM 10044 / NBRC 100330 / Delta H) TaxID=187420 RepID=O27144_METTH|nr:hydrogenase formation protein HypD [Methanothermobacter thermautotrophicus]AAB85561.1 hydrogenase expression/formation protein HypD [Methanothermobacter thermautotrophicus str. Delta H]MDK2875256.1 hydrogenase expression/formation protein HypD [Methanothermobacter sp.]MDN5374800.1 hydrogenase expression/formation protein HypD [Methanothermobacter sp.]WBF05640.1 hydrogenase formation protein HypD [Methanothermobacter thermautotrophicus]